MALALPPYDIIVFFILWGLAWIGWILHECFVWHRVCCCRPSKDEVVPVENPPDGVVGEGNAQSNNNENQQQQQTPPSPTACVPRIIRFSLWMFLGAIVAWIITAIIWAGLGSSGMLGSLLFSPQSGSDCKATCNYYTKDGYSDWVDDDCCTYNPSSAVLQQKPQDVWLQRKGQQNAPKIHGWLMTNTTLATPGQPPLTIFYSHGSGGNIASGYRAARYKYYLSLGNVVLFIYDYPGYGRSTGDTTGNSVMESGVVAATWFQSYLNNRANISSYGTESSPVLIDAADANSNNGSSTIFNNVVLLGRSMGGAVTTFLGKHAAWNNARGLMLQSVFSNLDDLALAYFPMFGWVWSSYAADQYPQYSNTKNVDDSLTPRNAVCMYQSHSKDDEWVPFSLGKKVYDEAGSVGGRKGPCSRFVEVESALHTQPLTTVERSAIATWLNERRG